MVHMVKSLVLSLKSWSCLHILAALQVWKTLNADAILLFGKCFSLFWIDTNLNKTCKVIFGGIVVIVACLFFVGFFCFVCFVLFFVWCVFFLINWKHLYKDSCSGSVRFTKCQVSSHYKTSPWGLESVKMQGVNVVSIASFDTVACLA